MTAHPSEGHPGVPGWAPGSDRAQRDGRVQPMAQAEPLRAKVAGAAALPVWVAWKPMLVEAPGAIVPL